MALKKAGATADTTKPAREDADAIPSSIPRHGSHGTPKIREADSANFSYYKRASSYCKPLESNFLIEQWRLRAVVFGMSRRAALGARAAAVPAFEDKAHPERHKSIREELQAIASEAIDTAHTGDRAMRGTALHTLSEQADDGADLSHLDAPTRAAIDQWRRMMDRFVIHSRETFVVWDEFTLGGSYDRLLSPRGVMTAPDGARITPDDRVIVDLKSGADAKYFGAGYCGQQAGYAGGEPYVHLDDATIAGGATCRPGWPDGVAPHQGWALIPHIPIESPQDAGLMWVNLAQGRKDLEAARDLYESRSKPVNALRFADALLPELDATVVDNTVDLVPTLLDLIAHAATPDAFGPLFDQNADVWTPELTAAVKARLVELQVAA